MPSFCFFLPQPSARDLGDTTAGAGEGGPRQPRGLPPSPTPTPFSLSQVDSCPFPSWETSPAF